MTRDDIQKLLGGYATGTLTPEEQQTLFAAALEDQELFDALAKEQALRDLLRDPASRAHVLAALDDRPAPWWRWLLRPVPAGALAAACLAAVVGYSVWHARQAQPPVLIASNREPKAAAVPAEAHTQPEPAAGQPRPVPSNRAVAMPKSASPTALDGLASDHPAGSARLDMPLKRDAAPAPIEPPQPPAARPTPGTQMFEKTIGTAAPPAAAASKPAVLKKEENAAANHGDQSVLRGREFGPSQQQQIAAAPAAPVQTQADVTQLRNGAAAGENQLSMNGAVSQGGLNQAQSNQTNQLEQRPSNVTETVNVSADAVVLETQQDDKQKINRQMADLPMARGPAPVLAAKAAAATDVKWSALRRGRDGRLSPVAPDAIRAGDSIVVRLELYADGTLSVSEILPGSAAPRVLIASAPVKQAQTVDTPPLTLKRPGVRELLVRFTAQTAAPPQTIVLRFR